MELFTNHGGIHYGTKELINLKLTQGPGLSITPEHRQTVLTIDGLSDIRGDEVVKGMWIPQLVGYYKESYSAVVTDSYYLGLWYGDGYFGRKLILYSSKQERNSYK